MLIRIFIGIGLLVAFIGWLLYRLFIKKDLKQHLNDLYTWVFVLGIWGLIYWFILK